MIILSYSIYGFGNIISRDADLKDGVNVIETASPEEAETIRDFIISLLYGLGGRTGGGFRKKYFPGAMIRFGGELKLEVSGKQYLIAAMFGRTLDGDNVRLFELPVKRQLPVPKGKTIGELLLGVNESAFSAAVSVDFSVSGDSLGYLTPELSVSPKRERSFAVAEEHIAERLLQIKNSEDKSGELDKLVIMKMEAGNALARLSENDQKISAEKKRLEEFRQQRRELKSRAKNQLRKIEIAESCSNLLTKDKIQTVMSTIRQDETELKKLELQKECLDNMKRKDTMILPISALVLGITVLILGIVLFKPLIFAGCALLIFALATGIISTLRFNGRYMIVRDGVSRQISEVIDSLSRKVSEETDRLCAIMEGKTYGEYREIWRNSEEILRNATEDERRNAVLGKNDSDSEVYRGIVSEIGPIEEKIAGIQTEIDELSVNLSAAYSQAAASLEGIDERIKSLGDEYNIANIALETLKEAKKEIADKLPGGLFEEAAKIYFDTYGHSEIGFTIEEDFKIRAVFHNSNEITESEAEMAKMALKTAAAKQLLVSESSIVLLTMGRLPESVTAVKLPVDVRQVICFAY